MILIAFRLFFCFFLIPVHLSGADTLAVNQSLSGDQTLVSRDGNFEMGFFKPGESPKYYIGIWYHKTRITSETVVWVANRDAPISDKFSSELKIIDGNLVLLDKSKAQIWSTNTNSTATPASVVLLDDGNLVLRYGSNSSPPIWQSFDHPTHTFLPGGKLGYNKHTNTKQVLTSWKNIEDPGTGLFSLELDPNERQYLITWNRSVDYWTSGSWNDRDKRFSLLPEMSLNNIYNFSYVDNENESYFTYSISDSSVILRLIMDVSGQIQQLSWFESSGQWTLFWSQPRAICEVYGGCGPFGVCNLQMLPTCNCITGFEPRSPSDWILGSFSDGCMRKAGLNCSTKIENPVFIINYFKKVSPSPFPESEGQQLDESECRSSCLDYCFCNAYTFISSKCLHWNSENLNNISLELLSNVTYLDKIYIKVSLSDHHKNNTKVLIAGVTSACLGLVFLCSIGVIIYRRMKNRDRGVLSEEDRKGLDAPFFEFKRILSATENFSLANKLGQGGFGPVYKGTFPGGAEIAVKRLSSQSKQGLKEFKNEVLLIAKLQHRNLIRLLGYSMKNHEMILLYEFMPNKSLDHFIFDRKRCMRLDWALRFDIIMGIARGLLYLHQDSRLKIIHRDLKTSNVLLDGDMNPKISDFGLAKIVKGRDTDGSRTRIVGTFGYMAPEYALNGFFSVKSDVFSFGVVVLEIISGKRNTGYYHNKEAFSLISYAWSLWKDKKPLDLLDTILAESCNSIEVLRCMIIGLLCVQEDPHDRPTMTGVLGMLGMDIESLPDPKEPAFVSKTRAQSLPSYVSESEINQLTITDVEGR
ncbi:G-type lectin S-receptor-like serine/threonine-protein kinase At4g03230 [Bidens hawaiensis]|uniref:G-type lectin S-receptor-like serine/threonine-protein kinase At4g03230 n=1 Tax=Bidens hawaiensis TaxID=980011 RepID=UPI004049FBE1